MKNTCRLTKENENKKAQKGQEKIKEARGRTFESKDREKR
jgi:hypothetical protein